MRGCGPSTRSSMAPPRDGLKRPLFFVVAYSRRQNVKARYLATSDRPGEARSGVRYRVLEALFGDWTWEKAQYICDVDCDVFVEV